MFAQFEHIGIQKIKISVICQHPGFFPILAIMVIHSALIAAEFLVAPSHDFLSAYRTHSLILHRPPFCQTLRIFKNSLFFQRTEYGKRAEKYKIYDIKIIYTFHTFADIGNAT